MGGIAVAIDLRLEESGGRLPHATILLLLDRDADEFIARRADVDLMLVKPVDAGRAAPRRRSRCSQRRCRRLRRADDALRGRPRARSRQSRAKPASSSSSCSARGGTEATKATAQANDLILAASREHRPDDAILSEESKDDPARLDARARVDRRPARRHARVRRSRPHRLGGARRARRATGSPTRRRGRAARRRISVLSTDPRRRSRRRPTGPIRIARVAHPAAGARGVPRRACSTPSSCRMGSAGAKAMAVVLGDADVYAHSGGQYEWDSAAPVGVADGGRLPLLAARRLAAASTTSPTRTCPTCSCAAPSSPTRCSTPSRRAPRRVVARSNGCRRIATAARYTVQAPTGCGAAWLARSVRDAEAPGSNPGTPTRKRPRRRPRAGTLPRPATFHPRVHHAQGSTRVCVASVVACSRHHRLGVRHDRTADVKRLRRSGREGGL